MKFKIFTFVVICTVVLAIAYDAYALRISMKRIIFEGDKRSETLTVINNTDQEKTYRLSFRHYTMGETKGLKHIEDDELNQYPEIKWADDYIRFAPRRFTIQPGGAQQVRLFARTPRNLEEGEYRSHLWILTESKPEDFNEQRGNDNGRPAVRLAMQPGISLPLFLRSGDISSTASLENGNLQTTAGKNGNTLLKVDFRLAKDGEKSIYGNLAFYCTAGSEEFIAKYTKGWAIYTETPYRDLQFYINIPDGKSVNDCRTMRVVYESDDDDSTYAGRAIASLNLSL